MTFNGSGFAENPTAIRLASLNRLTSKVNEKKITLNGEL
jgi:hypothetical protein